MDCCSEWVPELRFSVVATFPVQSPTKKKHTPPCLHKVHYQIYGEALHDFCFHLDRHLLKTKAAALSVQMNVVGKERVYFILGKHFHIALMPLQLMNSLVYK